MAKIDLDSLNIEELAALRERIVEKLAEKVASRRVELDSEMERLLQYGKPSKKSQAAPAAKAKKSDEKMGDEKSDARRGSRKTRSPTRPKRPSCFRQSSIELAIGEAVL